MNSKTSIKAVCKSCKQNTNHTLLHEQKASFFDDDAGFFQEDRWQIIRCKGCDDISFRMITTDSDSRDMETGELEEFVRLYPNRGENTLQIKNYFNVDYKIRNIYRETIDAFNNDLRILCAGGLRGIIEGICNEQGIKGGIVEIEVNTVKKSVRKNSLVGKINGLHEKGLLTKKHAEILNEHRYLGNDAVHSLDAPSKDELKLAIEIVEHTLDNIYELEEKAADLKQRKIIRKRNIKPYLKS